MLPTPTIRDLGVRIGEPAPAIRDGRPIKRSAFFVTVNTNKGHGHCDVRKLANELHAAIKALLGDEGLEAGLIKFLLEDETGTYGSFEDIVEMQEMLVVEIGHHEKGGRVHSHFTVQFRHYTKLHLNKDVITHFILSRITSCKLYSLYVHIDSVAHSSGLLDYFTKNLEERVPEGVDVVYQDEIVQKADARPGGSLMGGKRTIRPLPT